MRSRRPCAWWLLAVLALAGGRAGAQMDAPVGGNPPTSGPGPLDVPGGQRRSSGGGPTTAAETGTGAEGATPPGAGASTSGPSHLDVPAGQRRSSGGAATTAAEPVDVSRPDLLMKALGIEDSPVDVYGWIQNTYTGNTNGRPPSGTNFALFPNHLANQWMGNQYYVVLENPLEQNDTVNLGFRVDTLFGNDWQVTHSHGLFDDAFPLNSFRGLDFPQIYGQIHLPFLTRGGLEIKGGRFYSIAGYEQVMATKRPLLSWPYLLTFTPFTFFGVLSTLHLTDHLNLYNGAVNGPDRWIDRNYRYGYLGGFGWNSRDGKTSLNGTILAGAANQFPSFSPANAQPVLPTGAIPPGFLAGRRNLNYRANDTTYLDLTMTRKWNDRLTEAAEAFTFLDRNVPEPGDTVRNHAWYGAAHWFLYDFHPNLTGVWRAEIFRDDNGAATGVADTFYEMTLGLLARPRPWLWVRPEARYDWAQFTHPFNDGTRGSRFTLGIDVIVLF